MTLTDWTKGMTFSMELPGICLEEREEGMSVKLPKIIGLTGKMGAGKDTAGEYLVKTYGYVRRAFADGVREEASEKFPELDREIWTKPTSKRARILLQWWGTEYRREQDPQYWVKRLVGGLNPSRRYVITDVRFPNEATALTLLGGEVWRVEGRESENVGVDKHASERIEDITVSRVLDNSQSRRDLYTAIDGILMPEVLQ